MDAIATVTDDIVYGASGADAVEAWLVRPAVASPRAGPGLVLWHWLDTEAPDGNRDEFLDEARELAARLMAGLELRRAAGGGEWVELKPYDAEHDMRVAQARTDRRAFLEATLGLARAGS